MKILAIGAHPDDIEIFMYGLLKLLKNNGNEIFLAIATDGALGGDNSKENLVEIRKKESLNGLKDLGIPYFFNFPDGHLGDDNKHKVLIKSYINDLKPSLLITHHKKDYHSDHRILSNYVKNAAGHYIPILNCETMMGLNFLPNYYVDITKFFENKKNAVLSHISQNPLRFINLIKMMNGYRAAQCNSPLGTYTESYYFENSFPFSDIKDLLPPSPPIKPFHIQNQNGFL